METLNLLMQGFATAATPINLMWAFVGCMIGTAVGVLPGIGPAVAVAMLLPITVKVEATASMIFLEATFWTLTESPTAAASMALPCSVRLTPRSRNTTWTTSSRSITRGGVTSRLITAAPARNGRLAALPMISSASRGAPAGAATASPHSRSSASTMSPALRLRA